MFIVFVIMNKAFVNIHVQIFMWTNALWKGLSGSIGLSALLHSAWDLWHRFQDSYSSACHFSVAYVSGGRKVAKMSCVLSLKSNSPAVAHIAACPLWSNLVTWLVTSRKVKLLESEIFCLALMYQTRNSFIMEEEENVNWETL